MNKKINTKTITNTENGNKESTVKSNQGKPTVILGNSIVKDVDCYLLMRSIDRKVYCKSNTFLF